MTARMTALEMLDQHLICWCEQIEELQVAIEDEEVSLEDTIFELRGLASGFKSVANDLQEGK